jgi:hypothetical protein
LQVKLVTAPWRPTVTIFLDSVEEYDVPFFWAKLNHRVHPSTPPPTSGNGFNSSFISFTHAQHTKINISLRFIFLSLCSAQMTNWLNHRANALFWSWKYVKSSDAWSRWTDIFNSTWRGPSRGYTCCSNKMRKNLSALFIGGCVGKISFSGVFLLPKPAQKLLPYKTA